MTTGMEIIDPSSAHIPVAVDRNRHRRLDSSLFVIRYGIRDVNLIAWIQVHVPAVLFAGNSF